MTLSALLAFGCATAPSTLSHQVAIPELEAQMFRVDCTTLQGLEGAPRRFACWETAAGRGVLLGAKDLERLVIELKTACLALGGTPAACQTD